MGLGFDSCIHSPAAMLHFSALAFLRETSPNLSPTYELLTGGARLIPPNFLGVVRCLFRGGPLNKCQGAKMYNFSGREDGPPQQVSPVRGKVACTPPHTW